MRATALAGRFAPRDGDASAWGPRLAAALRADGPATSLDAGPLTVAWTPAGPGPDDGVVCVVDGRPRTGALAAELGEDPQAPADQLIALGYRRLGERVLELVTGGFALLLWDGSEYRGLLARDGAGARPLFVAERGGALLFGSEIRNLIAALPARPAPDAVAMAHWLARTSGRHDRTLYDGIRRLPAGHALRLSGDGWERWRHWRPHYAPPRRLTVDEAAAEVRSGLSGAVERALEGTDRPAVMLSGGFDSSAVAATARALREGRSLTAYSVVFPGNPAVDESARIAAARDWIGLPAVEAAFADGSPLGAGLEFMRTWEVPSATPNLFIWLPLLRRAAADGVDAMLDGEGGDELFGCAPYLVADALRAGRLPTALRTARRLPGMGDAPSPRLMRRALLRFGLRPALPYRLHEPLRRARGRSRVPDWLGDEARAARRIGDDPWAWKRTRAPRWWAHLADALTDFVDVLGAADQLRRESALAGVELRHPLRDPQLAELVLGLPPAPAFDPHLDRALARRALEGALPPEVLRDDTKPVFNSVLTSALEGRDRQALRALLAEPHPELARQVRAAAVAALLRGPSSASRPRAWAVDLWRLASLELWLEYQSDPALGDRLAGLDHDPAVSFSEI